MKFQLDDTIAALASSAGSAARGIVRLCGTETKTILDRIFVPDDSRQWQITKRAKRFPGKLNLSVFQVRIEATVYFWPDTRSYTGQPSAEIHLVGSPPVLEELLAELFRHRARLAGPGEFTMRAFLAGKIDLVQAEAVLGVIDANDQQDLENALGQLAGGISRRLKEMRESLVTILADLEAGLDFADEDIEFITQDRISKQVTSALLFVEQLLDQARTRMQSTGRRRVVLAGLPNVGKSSLFNRLTENEALVSPVEGTTRDYLTESLNWKGLSLELVDTAGWRISGEYISQRVQETLEQQLANAELVVWCSAVDFNSLQQEIDEELFRRIQVMNDSTLRLKTKGDLLEEAIENRGIVVSSKTGNGIKEFWQAVIETLTKNSSQAGTVLGMTAARCRESLNHAQTALKQANDAIANKMGDEILAIELREALDHLGHITGEVYTDEILDQIFRKFCIGK